MYISEHLVEHSDNLRNTGGGGGVIYLSIHPSIYQSIYLSISIYISTCI